MFDVALDFLKTPGNLLYAIGMLMAVLVVFKGSREGMRFIFSWYRYFQPIPFAWAALIVARKLDWSIPEQTSIMLASFFGFLGFVGPPLGKSELE
jgi:hypothetical protein